MTVDKPEEGMDLAFALGRPITHCTKRADKNKLQSFFPHRINSILILPDPEKSYFCSPFRETRKEIPL